ncbi:MAG: CARDB domain-containing protein, partial [Verrucomicrobiota bacterium]
MKTKALVLAIALIAASISHATSLPNLTPYQPSGWSDKIVVTRTSGSTTDSTSLTTADSLYMDWAVINNGATATTNGFYTDLYIDGVHTARFNTPGTLSVGSYASVTAYPIGSFSAGTHTIEIIADSTGLVAESNESDNSYTKTITVGNPPLPNLTPYQPSGWSDKIVVTRTSGSTTDSTGLTSADTLYMDWAVINNGTAATTSGFYTALYIDGVKTATFNTAGTLTVGSYASVTGYSLGSFSAGTHTIEIVADSTGLIAESNESDNSYTKTITVGNPPLPNLTPYQPSGWSDKIVVTRTSGST